MAANAEDRPVAFIDLEPDGHIDRLFCAPEASELARRVFERKGFTVVQRQDLVIRGVPMHNYRMAKALD
ncbi:MAG TPA: hypothetical protein VHZ03_37580 [Trebonia sp.]|nr:hypothetical protein [Trebonia sp.]